MTVTGEANALGAYLSSRRGAVDPSSLGLPEVGLRRVAGLRREEVAVLAGVSADYYTRLEQGRETHPSPAVLDGLCRALGLGADAREHLYRLAGALPTLRDAPASDAVADELRLLLDDLDRSPALVLSDSLDVLARNPLAELLHEGFELRDNTARMVFLDPLGRSFYVDWERAAESNVAVLRLAQGLSYEHRRTDELVAELTASSREFRDLWGRHDVRAKTNETKLFDHPRAGRLRFAYQSFDVRAAPGQQLVVFGRIPGDDSAERLAR